jgi:hypothetical protein
VKRISLNLRVELHVIRSELELSSMALETWQELHYASSLERPGWGLWRSVE